MQRGTLYMRIFIERGQRGAGSAVVTACCARKGSARGLSPQAPVRGLTQHDGECAAVAV